MKTVPFGKNPFSRARPSFRPATRRDADRVSRILDVHFDGLGARRIDAILSGFGVNSRNWKVRSNRGAFVLKESAAAKAAALENQARFAERLRRDGFPTVRFRRSKKGSLVAGDRDGAYCLTSFEEGRYYSPSSAGFRSLLKAARKLYDLSCGPTAMVEGLPERIFFEDWETEALKELRKSRRRFGLLKNECDAIAGSYVRLRTKAARSRLKKAVFHVDIHPLNLVYRGPRLICVTDFDSFQRTTVDVSAGFMMFKCLREGLTVSSRSLRVSRARSARLACRAIFPERTLSEWIDWGLVDVLKRLLWIVRDVSVNESGRWLFMAPVQRQAIAEIAGIQEMLK